MIILDMDPAQYGSFTEIFWSQAQDGMWHTSKTVIPRSSIFHLHHC